MFHVMNCNLTHFSTHDKWNRTCVLETFTSTYFCIRGLNIESQVQRIALRNTLSHTVCSVAHIFSKWARPCSYFRWKLAYCAQYTYCKTSMPFRTCITFSFSQQPKDAEAWIQEWQTDGGERGRRRGSGGGGVRVTGGSVRVSCDRKNGMGFAKLCESSWGHSPLSLLTRVIFSVKSLHHTDRMPWFEKG